MKNNIGLLGVLTGVMALAVSGTAAADGRWWNPDRAVTNWLVVVNNPAACSNAPCSEADIFGSIPAVPTGDPSENPTKASVCFLTGQVVGWDGKATFAGRVAEGQGYACFFPGDPDPYGLRDSMNAEIHVVVQEHGQGLPSGAGLEEQVAYFQGACNPNCSDTQFAIHVPGAAVNGVSVTTVHRFSDGSPVMYASSTLYREKHGVRVVLNTRLDSAWSRD